MSAGPDTSCPACGGLETAAFHTLEAAPTSDVGLFRDREAARAVSRAPIELWGCETCGFAWNAAFDGALVPYDADYESTQIHSPTFRGSLAGLIGRLVKAVPPSGGPIVEVGCGQGELLTALCDAAGREGLGVDPAYRGTERVGCARFLAKPFDPADVQGGAALLICKMTLEHLPRPFGHVQSFAASLAEGGRLFLQIPRFDQLLADRAFWDVYYEHCNYFAEQSLRLMGRRAGLRPLDIWPDYGGQYVLGLFERGETELDETPLGGGLGACRAFAEASRGDIAAWRAWLDGEARDGRAVALWGGGSKAVSFVTHLGEHPALACAIDINPAKRGSFLPGSGLPVVAPGDAADRRIAAIVLMNPIYRQEVTAMLGKHGLAGLPLLDVGAAPVLR